MYSYIITYDLLKAGQDYTSIHEYLQSLDFARPTESTYIIKTEKTLTQLFNDLSYLFDSNDHFFIAELTQSLWVGRTVTEVFEWLNNNL